MRPAYTFARIHGTVHFRATKTAIKNVPQNSGPRVYRKAHDVMGKEGVFPYSHKPFLAAYTTEKHMKCQLTFQTASKPRDGFLHAHTVCVFSDVYRVFTKSRPLGDSRN